MKTIKILTGFWAVYFFILMFTPENYVFNLWAAPFFTACLMAIFLPALYLVGHIISFVEKYYLAEKRGYHVR